MKPVETPRPVALLVEGIDRCTVMEALLQRAMELEGDALTRRKGSTIKANLLARAKRLRALAAELQP